MLSVWRPDAARLRRYRRALRADRRTRVLGQCAAVAVLSMLAALAVAFRSHADDLAATDAAAARRLSGTDDGGALYLNGTAAHDDDGGSCSHDSASIASHLSFMASGTVSPSMAALWFVLALYVFLGVAAICDEYFGPALEKISDELQLSGDVAGATFLAAGSSAPELFTSLSDSFAESSGVGLGTIVGSAMFNLLVIVALSAIAASQGQAVNPGSIDPETGEKRAAAAPLKIDWRPLTRDASFYLGSIVLLCVCLLDGQISVPEAALLVGGYVGYIVFMMFNERIIARLCPRPGDGDDDDGDEGRECEMRRVAIADGKVADTPTAAAEAAALALTTKNPSLIEEEAGTVEETKGGHDGAAAGAEPGVPSSSVNLSASLKTAWRTLSGLQSGARRAVARDAFLALDLDSNGTIDRRELAAALEKVDSAVKTLATALSPTSAKSTFTEPVVMAPKVATADGGSGCGGLSCIAPILGPDPDPLSTVPLEYITKMIDELDANGDGEISLDEFVNALCAEPEPIVLEGMPFDGGLVDDGAPPPDDPKGGEAAPLEPRRGGIFGGGEEEEEEENDDDKWYWHRLVPPKYARGPKYMPNESVISIVFYILTLPFTAAFALTVPDCEHPRVLFGARAHWVTFFMSIVWIMLLCHYMVEGATAFGCTVGIPPLVMGQCFLAIGTSVPDAIASVGAARGGDADMAIANAIGSNVFDILLGLGLPWLLVAAMRAERDEAVGGVDGDLHVAVGDQSLWPGLLLPILILFSTVFFFIALLVANKWEMTPRLGQGLFAMYGVYFLSLIVVAVIG